MSELGRGTRNGGADCKIGGRKSYRVVGPRPAVKSANWPSQKWQLIKARWLDHVFRCSFLVCKTHTKIEYVGRGRSRRRRHRGAAKIRRAHSDAGMLGGLGLLCRGRSEQQPGPAEAVSAGTETTPISSISSPWTNPTNKPSRHMSSVSQRATSPSPYAQRHDAVIANARFLRSLENGDAPPAGKWSVIPRVAHSCPLMSRSTRRHVVVLSPFC